MIGPSLPPIVTTAAWEQVQRLFPHPCLLVNGSGKVVRANPSGLLWLEEHGVPTKRLLEAFPDNQQEAILRHWQQISALESQILSVRPTIGETYYEMHCLSLLAAENPEDSLLQVLLFPPPLPTEALDATADHWLAALDTIRLPVLMNSVETGRFLYVNPATCELFGLSDQEIQRTTPFDFVVDSNDTMAHIQEVYEQGELLRRPVLVQNRRGQQIWCEVSIHPFQLRNQPCFLATLLPQQEKFAWREENQRLRQILAWSSQETLHALWLWDHDRDLLWLSLPAQALLAVDQAEWSWPHLLQRFPIDVREDLLRTLQQHWSQQSTYFTWVQASEYRHLRWKFCVEYDAHEPKPLFSHGVLIEDTK